ncbi:MAG: hypothetical protein ACK4IX_13175, partial [Candidatus Sericytochromatia bacterium]
MSYSKFKNKKNIDDGLNSFYLKDIEVNNILTEFDSLIEKIERKFPEFTLNQCIILDRVLRNLDYQKARQILASYALRFQEYVLKNKITYVFGEISLGCELLFYYVSKYHSIRY